MQRIHSAFSIAGAVGLVVVALLLAGCTTPQAAQPTATRAPTPSSSSSAAAAVPSPSIAASPGVGAAASPAAQAGGLTVQMTNELQFQPAQLTVPRGATVTWTNTSSTQHTVTDDPSKAVNKADAQLPGGAQPWDSGNVDPGKTFQHTFDVAGTYKYFCTPHETAGMLGTIVVTG